jgi:hypothetical protein
MRKFSKLYGKSKYRFYVQQLFKENAVCGIMRKTLVEPDGPQMKI